jgi:hypothetical protein
LGADAGIAERKHARVQEEGRRSRRGDARTCRQWPEVGVRARMARGGRAGARAHGGLEKRPGENVSGDVRDGRWIVPDGEWIENVLLVD